jgi:MoxR-like ATPase
MSIETALLHGDATAGNSHGPALASGRMAGLDDVRGLFATLREACRARVQGRDGVIDLLLTALLADGHVLLEDHPGSGKTTLAKALGECIRRESRHGRRLPPQRRVQFTPDSLPSDVTGVTVYDSARRRFVFHPGPVFTNVLLADEINRTSPKVQAALLEAMAEKQVTIDNRTRQLDEVFFVVATQNPLDSAGTYPLPRAQLDRFLFKVRMTYLSRSSELEVLTNRQGGMPAAPMMTFTPGEIAAARRIILQQVRVPEMIREALVDVARATRADRRVKLGLSTRSLVQGVPALQAWAAVQGRDYVLPEDVADLAVPLFAHRIELAPGVVNAETVVAESAMPVLEKVARGTLAVAGYTPPSIPAADTVEGPRPVIVPVAQLAPRRRLRTAAVLAGVIAVGMALGAVARGWFTPSQPPTRREPPRSEVKKERDNAVTQPEVSVSPFPPGGCIVNCPPVNNDHAKGQHTKGQ